MKRDGNNIPVMRKRTSVGVFKSAFYESDSIPGTNGKTAASSEKKAHRRNNLKVVKRPVKRSTRAIVITLSCIAVMMCLFIVINIASPVGFTESAKNFFAGAGVTGKFPVELSVSSVNSISGVGSDIALLTDSNINLYNSSGGRIFSRQHGYANPKMCTSESRVLTYDSGSTGYRVDNRNGTVTNSESSYSIICGAVSDNGYYALTTFSQKYICETTVYSSDGEARFRWNSAEQYVTAVALSSDGRKVAVGTAGASDGVYRSVVHIFDISKTDALFTCEYKDDLILALSFNDGGSVGAVLEHSYSCIENNFEVINFEFGEDEIKSFDVKSSAGDAVVLTKYNDSKKNTVLLFDKTGKTRIKKEYGDEVVSCCTGGKYVYILSKGKIDRVSSSDENFESAEVLPDCMAAVSVKSRIVTVSPSRLNKISF